MKLKRGPIAADRHVYSVKFVDGSDDARDDLLEEDIRRQAKRQRAAARRLGDQEPEAPKRARAARTPPAPKKAKAPVATPRRAANASAGDDVSLLAAELLAIDDNADSDIHTAPDRAEIDPGSHSDAILSEVDREPL